MQICHNVYLKAPHIPRVNSRRWVLLRPLDHTSLLEGHILTFARTNKYLHGTLALCSPCNYTPRGNGLLVEVSRSSRHLLEASSKKYVNSTILPLQHVRTWRQWASQPTTRGTANKTGKKSNGKPDSMPRSSVSRSSNHFTYPLLGR